MMTPLFGFNLGPQELVLIGLASLLIFGNRVPSMMRSLGQGVTEFKKGIQGIQDEVSKPVEQEKAAQPETPKTENVQATS